MGWSAGAWGLMRPPWVQRPQRVPLERLSPPRQKRSPGDQAWGGRGGALLLRLRLLWYLSARGRVRGRFRGVSQKKTRPRPRPRPAEPQGARAPPFGASPPCCRPPPPRTPLFRRAAKWPAPSVRQVSWREENLKMKPFAAESLHVGLVCCLGVLDAPLLAWTGENHNWVPVPVLSLSSCSPCIRGERSTKPGDGTAVTFVDFLEIW